ncbi:pyrroline-5-carboxylate reductase [Streptomyces sp. BV129]|uniref:pyrroline-5-carboxylate reductase family protein n=1 Tax=Streptomyces sp. BV129 TaxID=2849671 RepID=UPI001C2E4B8E|nr:hypothetical protein [Streptomyces sp. BV129]MBV1947221.1 hypothetical protein [Streptomyces sp. BV129]
MWRPWNGSSSWVPAGVRLETLASALGTGAVLRATPNLAARVGRSMTVVCPGPQVPPEAVQRAEGALSVIGRVLVVQDESLLAVGAAARPWWPTSPGPSRTSPAGRVSTRRTRLC